jgi:single-strand DNA-binding protein
MNHVYLMGRLGKDPELKTTKNGLDIACFSLAVQRPKRKGDKEAQTDWFFIKCFGKTASFVQEFFFKGDGLLLDGRIQTDKYTNKEGEKASSTYVVADRVYFPLGSSKKEGREQKRGSYNPEESEKESETGEGPGTDDDIPF